MNSKTSPNVSSRSIRRTLAQLCMTAALVCGAASAVHAEDVILNSNSARAAGADVRLIRTRMTPKKVTLAMTIPMTSNECVNWGTRVVGPEANASRCGGYHQEPVYSCRMELVYRRDPRTGLSVCVSAPNPRTGKPECIKVRQCATRLEERANVCSYEVADCKEYKDITRPETREITLKFKNMARLSGEETEIFELSASQKAVDAQRAVYSVKNISTQGAVDVSTSRAKIVFKGSN